MGGQYISASTQHAIDLMVVQGLRRKEAAEAAGMTDHGLREALKKPHVRSFRNERERAYLDRVGWEGVRTAEKLMRDGKSEHVRLDAAKYLAAFNEELRKARGDQGGGGANVNVTLALQGIQAQQLPQGWKPPKGAAVPEHLIQDQQSNSPKTLEHKEDGDVSDDE
jgi:hypothetical protein